MAVGVADAGSHIAEKAPVRSLLLQRLPKAESRKIAGEAAGTDHERLRIDGRKKG